MTNQTARRVRRRGESDTLGRMLPILTVLLVLALWELAARLLANPQVRISEVAYEAGFASLTHFNRMFRRLAGQSPSDFRQRTLNFAAS